MLPINVIICGEAVAEVDATIAALCSAQSVPIPETNLIPVLEEMARSTGNTQTASDEAEAVTPGYTIGDTFGKPPTMKIPVDRLNVYPGGLPLLTALSVGGGGDEDDGKVSIHLYHAKEPSLLLATSVKPHVLVVSFVPLLQGTFRRIDQWMRVIDRMYPRPPLILCGTRGESLGVRSVSQLMKDSGIAPVEVEDICDMALRWRCVTYIELSAALFINVTNLGESMIKACVGEPEKRLHPDAIAAMRQQCVTAALQKQSIWGSRRNPKNNKLFYYNRITKRAQWNRPPDYDGEEPVLTLEERIAEEQRKLEEAERKMDLEREETDLVSQRQELEEYESRMAEKNHRHQLLSQEVNRLQTALDALRERQQANINERQALERRKEELGLEEIHFSKTNVDIDRDIDARIQIARSKIFELEAVAVLRAEEKYAVEIAEALVMHRGLASAIRDVLKDEVATQQQSSAAQVAHDATAQRLEELTLECSRMETPISAARASCRQLQGDLQLLEEREQGLKQRMDTLRAEAESNSRDAFHRHERSGILMKELEVLDAEIAAARDAHEVRVSSNAQDQEKHRLRLLRDSLIKELVKIVASVATTEVVIRKRHIELQYVNKEFNRVTDALLDLYRNNAQQASSECAALLEGAAYSPIATAGLEASILEMQEEEAADTSNHKSQSLPASKQTKQDDRQKKTPRRSRGIDTNNMLTVFTDKVHAAKEANAAAKKATTASAHFGRVSQMIAHQKMELEEACTMAMEALERPNVLVSVPAPAGDRSKTSPLDRLVALVAPLVQYDVPTIHMLREAFTTEVTSRVTPLDWSKREQIITHLKETHRRLAGEATNSSSARQVTSTLTDAAARSVKAEKSLVKSMNEYHSLAADARGKIQQVRGGRISSMR